MTNLGNLPSSRPLSNWGWVGTFMISSSGTEDVYIEVLVSKLIGVDGVEQLFFVEKVGFSSKPWVVSIFMGYKGFPFFGETPIIAALKINGRTLLPL